jgi:hypothetical protein
VRGLTQIVPLDGELSYRNSGHMGSPVKDFDGATRCYSFIAGDDGVTVALGASDRTRITWGNGYTPVETIARETAREGHDLIVYRVHR